MSDTESQSERTKFMLAIARQVYDTPAELLLGLSKVIAAVICIHSRDQSPEVLRESAEEIATLIKAYVNHGITVREHLERVRASEDN